jgi:hypothetical protein
MSGFRLLSHSLRHPIERPAGGFDLALRLFPLPAVHLRHGLGQPPASALEAGNGQFQVALECGGMGCERRWRLPLRFQKQLRLGQDALAGHARAGAPGGVELPGLARVAMVLDQRGGHPLAVVPVGARHRRQIPHRHLRRYRSFAHLLLNRFR